MIKRICKVNSPDEIQSFDKKGRDNCLGKLKREGLVIRQLERFTGIKRGVIQKA